MPKFLIKYQCPKSGEYLEIEREFQDAAGIPAKEWAEDLAYTLADKGPYTITRIIE